MNDEDRQPDIYDLDYIVSVLKKAGVPESEIRQLLAEAKIRGMLGCVMRR